jgi:hypothetical protein
MRPERFGMPMKVLIVTLMFFTMVRAVAAADGSDQCDGALLPQITIASSSVSERVAYLSLITEGNYEQARAGGALNVIIEDLPIGASYQQFNEKRRQYYSRQSLNYDRSQARAMFRQSLTDAQLGAWTSCMTSDVPGVRIILRSDDKEGAEAEVHYIESPGRSKNFTVTVAGGYALGGVSAKSFTLDHGGAKGILLKRSTPSSKLKILVNGRNMTDTAVSLPPPKKITPPVYQDCSTVALLSNHAPATASSNNGGAGAVTDDQRNPGNWNANAGAPQWVEIDLGGPKRVRHINLNPEQTPAGYTQHRLYGRRPDGTMILLGEYNANTISGGVFTVVVDPRSGDNVRSLRVETISSPSSVSWREIEIYGCQ